MKREIKGLLFNILSFEDEVKADGARLPRTSVKKDYFFGWRSSLDKLLSQVEVGYKQDGNEEILWVKQKELPAGAKPIADRFTEEDLELTTAEVKAVRYCYNQRDEVPAVSTDLMNEFLAFIENK